MLRRRLVTIPAVLLALPVLVFLGPLLLAVGALADVVGRLFRFPTVRLMLFGIIYLGHEWAGLAAAVVLGVRQRLIGGRWSRARAAAPYRRVQAWWVDSLLRWADRLLHVRFECPDPTTLPSGPFIILSRHASMIDAVIPAQLVTSRLGRFAHYVIKRELRVDPNLDVYGHRLGNYFLARSNDGDEEAEAIARFAADALPDSALIIFPEGTYATPGTRARVLASLERKGHDDVAAYARGLDHLLPPKPTGTLTLLDEQPELDVVVFGHVGLEGVAELSGLRRRLPLELPIVIDWWHHDRATIPAESEARIAWLNERWNTLDGWVAATNARRAAGAAATPETLTAGDDTTGDDR